jgi:hypothetical protein
LAKLADVFSFNERKLLEELMDPTQNPRIMAELQIAAACKKPVEIDILMVAHNQPELVKNSIQSLQDTTPNYHLYLYDNGSDSETADILNTADLRGGKLIRRKITPALFFRIIVLQSKEKVLILFFSTRTSIASLVGGNR